MTIEAAARVCSFSQPAINRIPGDSLYSSNRRFVQPFNTHAGDYGKGHATVLEPMPGRAGIGTECLSASAATMSTTPPPLGFVKSVADADAQFTAINTIEPENPEPHAVANANPLVPRKRAQPAMALARCRDRLSSGVLRRCRLQKTNHWSENGSRLNTTVTRTESPTIDFRRSSAPGAK